MQNTQKKLEKYFPRFPDLDRWLEKVTEENLIPEQLTGYSFFITCLEKCCEQDFQKVNDRIYKKAIRLDSIFKEELTDIDLYERSRKSKEINELKKDIESMYILISNLEYIRFYYLHLSVLSQEHYEKMILNQNKKISSLKFLVDDLSRNLFKERKDYQSAFNTIIELQQKFGNEVMEIYLKHLKQN